MPKAALQAVLDQVPLLEYSGFCVLPKAEREPALACGRSRLLNFNALFSRVVELLERHPEVRTFSVNKSCDSHVWKLAAERMLGTYVPNGVFIAAAIHLGFPFERQPGNPNAFLPISDEFLLVEAEPVGA